MWYKLRLRFLLPKRLKSLFLIGLKIIFFSTQAMAGVLQVAPVQISFASNKNIETLYITNHDQYPTQVQLDIRKSQTNILIAKSEEESTEDLLATPALFQLAPGQTQLVRIAIARDRQTLSSNYYRLVVREVINSTVSSDQQGIKFALQMLIPVRIEPTHQSS